MGEGPGGLIRFEANDEMLLTDVELQGIRSGKIDRVFRTWKRATVKTGGTLVTRIGLLAIDEAAPFERKKLSEFEAGRAGYDSLEALFERVDCGREGQIYRVRLHYAGPDPRIALRSDDRLSDEEVERLAAKLDGLDARSANGPWTRPFLKLLAKSEGVPAIELAQTLGYEKEWLKPNVRKLKALGLTESLQPGYRLSPRGEALLAALDRRKKDHGGPTKRRKKDARRLRRVRDAGSTRSRFSAPALDSARRA